MPVMFSSSTTGRGTTFAGASLVEMLRFRAGVQPDDRAFVFLRDGEREGDAVTYAELDRRCRTIAAELQRRVPPGARALLVYPPGLDFVAAFFGCLYARVVAVPVFPPRWRPPDRNLARARLGHGGRAAGRRAEHERDRRAVGPGGCRRNRAGARACLRQGGGRLRRSSLGDDRCAGRTDRSGLARSRGGRAHAGVSPVHVRLDRRPAGRDDQPRKPAAQPRLRVPPGRERPVVGVGLVAPGRSRHGADRRRPAAGLQRVPGLPDGSDGVPAAPRPVAAGDFPVPGDP